MMRKARGKEGAEREKERCALYVINTSSARWSAIAIIIFVSDKSNVLRRIFYYSRISSLLINEKDKKKKTYTKMVEQIDQREEAESL